MRGRRSKTRYSQTNQDITDRVSKLKLDAILGDLPANSARGNVVARLYFVESQQRGLPRGHILYILANGAASRSKADYDDVARAAIPDPEKGNAIRHTITTSLMRGPFGSLKPNAACMEGGSCAMGCQGRFIDATVEPQSFPEYKRPGDGRTVLKRGLGMSNHRVVPHTPRRASKYNAQINVDVCSDAPAANYRYKYVYKEPGRAAVEIANGEIAFYLDGGYFPAQEAWWRLLDFDLRGRCSAATRLHVHLEDEHSVVVREEELIKDISARPSKKSTMAE